MTHGSREQGTDDRHQAKGKSTGQHMHSKEVATTTLIHQSMGTISTCRKDEVAALDWQRNCAREKNERDLAEEKRNMDLEVEKRGKREKNWKKGESRRVASLSNSWCYCVLC